MYCNKNQKLSESKTDRISSLPDCVLQFILSLIPTKDAVATCILSKRWKFLWTSVPNIDFDDAALYPNADFSYPIEVTRFMNFVERVLLLRDSSSIKKFRLSCRVCFSASRVHAWVSAAVMHDIEELDLCFFVEKPFMLPLCVFDSKSLTVLKLQMNCELQLPNCISFPSLKRLDLCLVTFLDDKSMDKLFSNCPVLQELSILDCEWVNLRDVMISIPTLKSLTIDDLPYYGTFDVNGCQIKIDAENLMHLSYTGYLCNELIPCHVPSLFKAHIHIPNLFEDQKEVVPRTAKLLRGLQHVHSLRMSTRTIKSLFLAGSLLEVPIFQRLTCLELTMKIENLSIAGLMNLLHCSPNLESIHFFEGLQLCVCSDDDAWYLKPAPRCLVSCLKKVMFQNFRGYDSEICFLKYFLENALVLERMYIYSAKNIKGSQKRQKEVKMSLQSLDIGSKSCVLTFI
ncbi:F-box/LRR-repeat protein At4g14103-like isoform X1 [Apium graveolens]|uniref:F-box/LRR-repeat protein At4g14103-like isoform X1 n=2 Tax=Apium graveolens TaxID=4045 RepID=UPI003D791465